VADTEREQWAEIMGVSGEQATDEEINRVFAEKVKGFAEKAEEKPQKSTGQV
jgi:truncated hemoglobin YjbI